MQQKNANHLSNSDSEDEHGFGGTPCGGNIDSLQVQMNKQYQAALQLAIQRETEALRAKKAGLKGAEKAKGDDT